MTCTSMMSLLVKIEMLMPLPASIIIEDEDIEDDGGCRPGLLLLSH